MVRPVCTVSVMVPAFQAPFDCVPPTENSVSPSSPLSISVTGLVACAPVSPEIVISELCVALKSVSDTSVMVISFEAPGIGLLWPMAFVVKDCASTDRQ